MGSTFAETLSQKEIAQIILSRNINSVTLKNIETADAYFDGDNDINKKTRTYYDRDRKPVDNPAASNAKIPSHFLRMLVQQKQDYALAKSFVIKLKDENEAEIELKENEYGTVWKKLCDDTLFELAHSMASNAVNHGITWAYVWIDENGEFKIKNASAKNVFPEWEDGAHTKIDRLLYHTTDEIYYTQNPTVIEKGEYWSDKERILYNITESWKEENSSVDNNGNIITSHMTLNGEQVSWERVPFIAFKGTDDEKPLLCFIKSYIDAYDELNSKSVDGLVDDLDPLLVFKNISPDVRDLVEARELARMTRTISVDSDGDAHYIQAQTQIDAHATKMQQLRSDIIRFGYGIDYEDARFGGNPNQLVIKSLYQNLDTYIDGMERHFQSFIDDLKYFFDMWYSFTTGASTEELKKYKVLVKFDRSMMINQSGLIDDSLKLAGMGISKKTQLEFNPVVQDVELELERIKEEQEESEKNNPMFNFMRDTENTEEENQEDTEKGGEE